MSDDKPAKEENRTDLLPLDISIYLKEKFKLTSVYKKRLLLRFTQTPPPSPPPLKKTVVNEKTR